MRERALLVGGELDLTSDAGGGTEVRLAVPVPQAESELRNR
jgi:signal transduction histidine kinase